jgi:G3E family GTPase
VSSPYARRAQSVPVTVISDPTRLPAAAEDMAVVRLDPPLHEHAPGNECVACESRGNVRVLLFELDEKLRRRMIPPFTRVVVDATAVADPRRVADAIIPGRLPALGLRDHAVARNFHLDQVV